MAYLKENTDYKNIISNIEDSYFDHFKNGNYQDFGKESLSEEEKLQKEISNGKYQNIIKLMIMKSVDLEGYTALLESDYREVWNNNRKLQPYVGETILRLRDSVKNIHQAILSLAEIQKKFEKEEKSKVLNFEIEGKSVPPNQQTIDSFIKGL